MRRMDLTNLKFGRLTVISFSHTHTEKNGHKVTMWNCLCDCGKTKIIRTNNLRSKTSATVSCGCFHHEILKKGVKKRFDDAAIRYYYATYKTNAKKDKREFLMTLSDFKEIINKNCTYCGCDPREVYKKYRKSDERELVIANGVDRINSLKGYTLDNVTPCCTYCNTMKNVLTTDEFINHITKLYNVFENQI